jgi:hypothetical protein
MADYVF